jgi:hypothetical protein
MLRVRRHRGSFMSQDNEAMAISTLRYGMLGRLLPQVESVMGLGRMLSSLGPKILNSFGRSRTQVIHKIRTKTALVWRPVVRSFN